MLTSTPPPRSIAQCWSGPARGLLVAVAGPLGVWFAWSAGIELAPPAPWPSLVVDANTVPVPVLEALPGLGPALAGRIVAARQDRPFASLADLDRRVKGIGPVKASGLAPFLRFAAPE